jgi:hypothetical protein
VEDYTMDRVKKFHTSLSGLYQAKTTNEGPTRSLVLGKAREVKAFANDYV